MYHRRWFSLKIARFSSFVGRGYREAAYSAMSPAAVQLWDPGTIIKWKAESFPRETKGRRLAAEKTLAEKLISPLNARLLYVAPVLELKWAPRKPASAGTGAAFYGQRP